MIRYLVVMLSVIIMFSTKYECNAIMIDYSNYFDHVLYDTESSQYWMKDLNFFKGYSFEQQLTRIDELNNSNYFGLNTWHFASISEMQTLWANDIESISLFNSTYNNAGLYPLIEWYGRFDENLSHSTTSHAFWAVSYTNINGLEQWFSSPKNSNLLVSDDAMFLGAWVTAYQTSNSNPVPEPGTFVMLILGLVCTCWFFRRRRTKRISIPVM